MAAQQLTLTRRDRQWAESLVRDLRARDAYVTNARVPVRGTLDAMDEPFGGLAATRMEEELLGGAEGAKLFPLQNRPNYMDGIGLPAQIRSLDNSVKLTQENLVGEVVRPGNLNGQIRARKPGAEATNQVDWGNDSIPRDAIGTGKVSDNEIANVAWSKVGIAGSQVPNFATQTYAENQASSEAKAAAATRTTKNEVQNLIKEHVKPDAQRNF